MKALIVGGNGFLGRELSKRLILDGFEVQVFSRQIDANSTVPQTQGDLQRPESYRDVLAYWQPEIVIQAAWITEQSTYRTSPLNNDYGHLTSLFAAHCFQTGVKHFLAFGSSAEYGIPSAPCNSLITLAAPQDLYGKAKLETLLSLQATERERSQRITWARVFQAYGKSQDSARLIPSAVNQLLAHKSINLDHPKTLLDWVTSRDIASAVAFALKNDLPEIIDIGSSTGTTVQQVLVEVARLLELEPIFNLPQNPDGETPLELVVSKDSPLFAQGWSPQDDLNSGLRWVLSL